MSRFALASFLSRWFKTNDAVAAYYSCESYTLSARPPSQLDGIFHELKVCLSNNVHITTWSLAEISRRFIA